METYNSDGDTQNVERIALSMTAKLKAVGSVAPWIQANPNASRDLTQFVVVRNNITTKFVAAP